MMKLFMRYLGQLSSEIQDGYRKALLSLLERDPNARFLDCGCFDGRFTCEAAEKIGTKSVFGADFASPSLDEAKSRGVDARACDLNTTLPWDNESFDVVLANQSIEHLCNTDGFLKEIFRVLKWGGYSVISTPNLAASHNILFLLAGLQPFDSSVSDEVIVASWHPKLLPDSKSFFAMDMVGHRRLFTRKALEALLRHHSFMIEATHVHGYYPLPGPIAKLATKVDKNHGAYIVTKARKKPS